MTIKIKLYGILKEKYPKHNSKAGTPNILNIENNNIETVMDALNKVNIDESEISHIFVNGIYTGHGKIIKNNDVLGLFPKNMGLMFAEIPKRKSIFINVNIIDEINGYIAGRYIIDIPEGSTIKLILEKLKISEKTLSLIIQVNNKLCDQINFIVNNKDNVTISLK